MSIQTETCPICGEGELHETAHNRPVEIDGHKGYVYTRSSECDVCGCVQASPTQLRDNLMATLDISRGYRQYSPKELLSFAYNGTLTCKGFELEDFLCYIVQEIQDIEAEKWEKVVEAESEKVYREGVLHGGYED